MIFVEKMYNIMVLPCHHPFTTTHILITPRFLQVECCSDLLNIKHQFEATVCFHFWTYWFSPTYLEGKITRELHSDEKFHPTQNLNNWLAIVNGRDFSLFLYSFWPSVARSNKSSLSPLFAVPPYNYFPGQWKFSENKLLSSLLRTSTFESWTKQ